MALIKCPECGKSVSDKTDKCVHCGFPIYMKVNMTMGKQKCSFCGTLNEGYDKYCTNCGAPLEETEKEEKKEEKVENTIKDNSNKRICPECGKIIPKDDAYCVSCYLKSQNEQQKTNKKSKSKWVGFFLCLFLGFFGAHKFYEGKAKKGILYLCTMGLFLFGWIYDCVMFLLKPSDTYDPDIRSEQETSKKWVAIVVSIVFVLFMGGISNGSENQTDNTETENSEESYQETEESIGSEQDTVVEIETEEEDVNEKYYDLVELPKKYKSNFVAACLSCGINVEEISHYEKQDDWENGESYTFYYDGNTHSVYLLDNGEVSSINYMRDPDFKLYENGYESLNIADFQLDSVTHISLKSASEAVIEESVEYPETLNFDWWTTGSCTRYYDYYIISAEFTCKNAYGVKSRHVFRIDATVTEDGSDLVYYELDGVVKFGSPDVPEIKKIPL